MVLVYSSGFPEVDKDISMNSNSRIAALLFFCAVAAFSGVAFAESASCIVSGSTVRDAVHSGVSDAVSELDAVESVTAVSSGCNVNAYPFGTVLIVR